MKTARLITVLTLAACHACAQSAGSFVWQGNTFTNPTFRIQNESGLVEVKGGGNSGRSALVPFNQLPAAVQRQLTQEIQVKAKRGELLRGRGFQLTPDGVLIDPTTLTQRISGMAADPILLRGHPQPEALVEQDVAVYAAEDGKYQYTALNGLTKTVRARRYVADGTAPRGQSPSTAPAFGASRNASPATPLPFGGGSKMQGSSLDRR